jgi:hypothetical protein
MQVENLNLQIQDKDSEIAFLKRRINRTVFQSMLLVVGWTLYTGIKNQTFVIMNK